MLHPSRKIPKQQEKRRHWVDDKGWTHVTKGTRPTGQTINELKYIVGGRGPAKVPEGMTLQDAVDKYHIFRQRFQRSTCWAELEKFLEETILKVESLEIKSCVCTGFGSFTAHPKPGCPTLEAASFYQLAAFESMLEILRKINSDHSD
ncbi:MAG: hypothetical protein Q9187_004837 [Circinaria calcarea]